MNGLIERAHAAVDFTSPLTISTTTGSTTTIAGLIGVVVGWLSLIVGAVAFFYLIYSGILYISAAGNPDQAKKGQQGIVNAIIGIVICVLAYTIITVIFNQAKTAL